MAEKDLETRITKIEEYIKCCEEKKELEWKSSITKKLESIENRQIKTSWQWPAGFGVTSLVIGYNFYVSQVEPKIASIIIMALGLLMFLYAMLPKKNEKK